MESAKHSKSKSSGTPSRDSNSVLETESRPDLRFYTMSFSKKDECFLHFTVNPSKSATKLGKQKTVPLFTKTKLLMKRKSSDGPVAEVNVFNVFFQTE